MTFTGETLIIICPIKDGEIQVGTTIRASEIQIEPVLVEHRDRMGNIYHQRQTKTIITIHHKLEL